MGHFLLPRLFVHQLSLFSANSLVGGDLVKIQEDHQFVKHSDFHHIQSTFAPSVPTLVELLPQDVPISRESDHTVKLHRDAPKPERRVCVPAKHTWRLM